MTELNTEQKAGWEAALDEMEHQAEHFEQRGARGAAEILREAVRVAAPSSRSTPTPSINGGRGATEPGYAVRAAQPRCGGRTAASSFPASRFSRGIGCRSQQP